MNDGSSLSDEEKLVRDILKAKLGARATIAKLKKVGDTIELEVVSPTEFKWAAGQIEEAAPEIGLNLKVNLFTTWPR